MSLSIHPTIKEARTKNCVYFHKYCNANCCRYFTLPKTLIKKAVKVGRALIFRHHQLTPDIQWYLGLHGVTMMNKGMILHTEHYEQKDNGDVVEFWRDCNALGKDLRCELHPDKPKICSSLDETSSDDPSVTFSKNCRFKIIAEATR